MKKELFCRAFISLLIGVTFAAALPPGKAAGQLRQKRMSYDEINTRIASLQNRADSLGGVLELLRQDSARAGQELARQNAGQSKKQAEIEDALAKKRTMAASAKTQYEKARADSVAIITKTRDQLAAFRKELQQTETSLAVLNNELALLIGRQDRTNAPSNSPEEKIILKLQAQVAQRDSLVRERQANVEYLAPKVDKFRQDSGQAEAKRSAENNQFHQQTARVDSMIAAADAVIVQLEQKLAGSFSEKEQKAAQLQQSIALFTKQKQSTAEQINRSNGELVALNGEHDRLAQSSGSARQKYNALRTPYETAFTNADTAFQQAAKDKQVLIALRQKLRIDSAVFKTRDELDRAIQAEAEKKKGGKKLVEQRENELEVLLQRQDSITRATPGLRVRETQFRTATIVQKTVLVDTALAQSNKKIAAATAQRDKAKQNLAVFEQKNPEPQNTSPVRIMQLDTLIVAKKKEIIHLISVGDSLNILLQEVQGSVSALSTKGKGETGKADSVLQNRKNDKLALVAKRTKIQRDSAQAEAVATASMLRLKTDMASVNSQTTIAKNEIATLTADRDKSKQAIVAAQEKNRQSLATMASEKKKSDSIAYAKQEGMTLLSAKIEKIRKDSNAVARQQDQQIKAIIPSPASLAGPLTSLDKELLVLQMQRDSIARAALGGPGHSDAEKKISLHISAVNRAIESTQSEIVSMNAMKEEAFKRLKNDKTYYDSLAGATEREIAGLISRRDKTRLDSIQAENNVRQSSGRAASVIRQHDSIIAVRQRDLSDITAEYSRLVDESNRASEKANPSLPGFSQSLISIDAQIAAKEREIADLRAKKDRIKQDSIAESRRQAGLLAAARAEMAKRNVAVEQKKLEVTLAIAEKKKAQADTGSIQKKALEAIAAATIETRRLNDLLTNKQAELGRVQKERDAVAARIKATSERGSGIITTDEPAPPAPAAAAPAKTTSMADLAQKKAEEIYTLLGENKTADASKKFKSMQIFFKTNLDAESFTALKTTIEQMGGTTK